MERDFLKIGGSDAAVREEMGFLGRSELQGPFSSMIPAKQQLMNFQTAQEERSKNITFKQHSSSAFQHVSAIDPFASTQTLQNHSVMDGRSIHQFHVPGYSTNGADHPNEIIRFPAVAHDAFPIGTSRPYFRVGDSAAGSATAATPLKQQFPFGGRPNVASPNVGLMGSSFAPRDVVKPSVTTAQLTIFYAGTVNVYEDVPPEKVQAIMFLAGHASNVKLSNGNIAVEAPRAGAEEAAVSDKIINCTQSTNQNQTQRNLSQTCSTLSSPVTPSHSGAQSGGGSQATNELTGAKASVTLIPASRQEPPRSFASTSFGSASRATLAPRAIPQARKASLARFLEKRKERVTSVAPYPSPHKTTDYSSVAYGKSATAEAATSSSIEQTWCFRTQKNNLNNSNPPSTKLEI